MVQLRSALRTVRVTATNVLRVDNADVKLPNCICAHNGFGLRAAVMTNEVQSRITLPANAQMTTVVSFISSSKWTAIVLQLVGSKVWNTGECQRYCAYDIQCNLYSMSYAVKDHLRHVWSMRNVRRRVRTCCTARAHCCYGVQTHV